MADLAQLRVQRHLVEASDRQANKNRNPIPEILRRQDESRLLLNIGPFDGRGVFSGLASPIEASRYHSLIVEEQGLPDVLEVSARSRGDGIIMGLRHKTWPLQGVQFHPESVLTSEGRRMLRNFMDGK